MTVIALNNIENEIQISKWYECEEVGDMFLLINDLGVSKSYDKLKFGVPPIEEIIKETE